MLIFWGFLRKDRLKLRGQNGFEENDRKRNVF